MKVVFDKLCPVTGTKTKQSLLDLLLFRAGKKISTNELHGYLMEIDKELVVVMNPYWKDKVVSTDSPDSILVKYTMRK